MRRLPVAVAVGVLLVMLSSGVALAAGEAGDSNNLPAGAIVGLVFSAGIATILLLLSLGYILPKPPGR